ncbi:alcohol dehydrogenase [Talaromyces proteolyticus]|uniref:Alcohol dehydrogenase n=1 Tax=Talaromyces proteolyticus TaxID=1131652 RepID=A0AAD4PU97_9EURO|nr:alcohol dehydrogenase [Talaromyces proteolyticus]KAH8689058.1 alcohol dehydrogenase [Talaromyces proteolyticus]
MDIKTSPVWILEPKEGFEGLKLHPSQPLPELNDHSCLIQIDAVSLNYRDVAIPKGQYPMAFRGRIIPCSDGAATVIKTGPAVTRFAIGDRVCTLFNPSHQSGYFTPDTRKYSLGSSADGTLRKYAVFHETALVSQPKNITSLQAATLPCAGVTAWNAFYGIADRKLQPGSYVLTQGTGGVSLIAIQIALAVGATVIATTSSPEKANRLKEMGVQHVINYRETPNWGEVARQLTPENRGVDHILEVGGEATIRQSLKAIKMEGVISIIGFLGGANNAPQCSFQECLSTLAIVRGTSVGSKEQFKELNAFIQSHNIQPIVDSNVFDFQDAPRAFQYLWDQKQWGKVVIHIK